MNNQPNFNDQGYTPAPNTQYTPDPFADEVKQAAPRGLAVASLVLGILSAAGLCCCCTPLCVALGVVAIVLAIIYSKKAGKLDGMALAGLILGIIGVVIALIVLIVLAANPDLQERIIQTIMGQTPDVSLPDIKVPESIG